MYQYINLKEGTNLSLLTQKPRTASGYRGVYWSSKKKAWNVKVGLKSKIVFNNHFTSFSEAVLKRMELEEKYYNPILIKYGLPVIPRPDIIKNDFVLKKEKERKNHLSNPLGSNKYRHVSFDKVRQKYVVQMRVNGK